MALHREWLGTFLTVPDPSDLLAEVRTQLETAGPTLRQALVPMLAADGPAGVEQLVQIAANSDESSAVRRVAINALEPARIVAHHDALHALWQTNPAPRLRAQLLPLLWPAALNGMDLIRLTPFTDDARWFAEQHAEAVIDALQAAEIPKALAWAEQRPWTEADEDPLGRVWPLVPPLVERAWHLSDRPPVREALARFLLTWIQRDVVDTLQVDWGRFPRRLWRIVCGIVHQAESVEALKNLRHAVPIRWRHMLPWLVDEMDRSLNDAPEVFERWGEFWQWIRDWDEHLPRVQALAERHDGLAKRLEDLKQLRGEPYQPEARPGMEAGESLSTVGKTREWLAGDEQHCSGWVGVCRLARRLGPSSSEPTPVAETILWSALTDTERQQLQTIALDFLMTDAWSVAEVMQNDRWAAAASQAWRLLLGLPSTPTRQLWRRWLPLLLDWWPFKSIDIVHLARQTFEGAFNDELLTALATLDGPQSSLFEKLEPYWFAALTRDGMGRLRDLKDEDSSHWRMARLLETLLRQAQDQALAWAMSHIELDWVLTSCLRRAPGSTWSLIWSDFDTDAEFSNRVLDAAAAARYLRHTRWWDAGAPSRLALICERIHARFPERVWPEGKTRHAYTPNPADWARMAIYPIVSELISQNAEEQVRHLDTVLDLPPGYVRRALRHRTREPLNMRALAQSTPQPDSAEALKWLIVDTLQQIQVEDLDGPISVRDLFFRLETEDTAAGRLGEVRSCQLLAKLLKLRLPDSLIVLEPQVSEGRMRLDVQVARGDVTVIIEAKWADHADVDSALPHQLGAYLNAHQHTTGVYLVFWYSEAMVPAGKKYRVATRWRDLDKLEQHLRAQADADGRIEPVVLALRRPRSLKRKIHLPGP